MIVDGRRDKERLGQTREFCIVTLCRRRRFEPSVRMKVCRIEDVRSRFRMPVRAECRLHQDERTCKESCGKRSSKKISALRICESPYMKRLFSTGTHSSSTTHSGLRSNMLGLIHGYRCCRERMKNMKRCPCNWISASPNSHLEGGQTCLPRVLACSVDAV